MHTIHITINSNLVASMHMQRRKSFLTNLAASMLMQRHKYFCPALTSSFTNYGKKLVLKAQIFVLDHKLLYYFVILNQNCLGDLHLGC